MAKEQNAQLRNLAVPLAVALALPSTIVGALFILGDGVPGQAIVVIGGAYAMAVVWTGVGRIYAGQEARLGKAQMAVAQPRLRFASASPGLDLAYTVPLVTAPRSVRVVGEVGVCPRGLKLGDTIAVDSKGALSSPLCRVAAGALGPVLSGGGDESLVSCVCPMAGRHLTFAAELSVPTGVS